MLLTKINDPILRRSLEMLFVLHNVDTKFYKLF